MAEAAWLEFTETVVLPILFADIVREAIFEVAVVCTHKNPISLLFFITTTGTKVTQPQPNL